MNRKIIFIILTALLISSCSIIERMTAVESTPTEVVIEATPTPDPCTPENLLEEVERVQDLVNKFQDLAYLANFTPQTELIVPIMEMQAVRRELQKLDVPDCEAAIKTASLNYMNATINYLAFFMGGETQENVDAGIQNSQALWDTVLAEFNNLLSSAGLASDDLPDITDSTETETTDGDATSTQALVDTGIIIGNEGVQAVNIRSQPDINADIISSLEPGTQAIGLSRNANGDWLLVDLDGVIGWVYTEMVTSSEPTENMPVSDPNQ
jgi:hypothetical protein